MDPKLITISAGNDQTDVYAAGGYPFFHRSRIHR